MNLSAEKENPKGKKFVISKYDIWNESIGQDFQKRRISTRNSIPFPDKLFIFMRKKNHSNLMYNKVTKIDTTKLCN